jgi:protease-4
MKNKVLGCLGVVLVIALFGSVMLNIFLIARSAGSLELAALRSPAIQLPPFRAIQVEAPALPTTRDRIVQIDLTGIITGDATGFGSMVSEVKRALRQAADDRFVRAIVLRIDSPGGEVTASDTIYKAVKETGTRKPIVVFMDSMAASGGYYIACGSRRIIAHPLAITGSIGVIMQGIGYDGLLGKVGVEMRTFKSGPMKDAGSGSRPMTEAEKEFFQRMVLQNYDRFVQIVSDARGIPVDELRNGIADGRIYLGEEARARKLIDETGYIEQAYAVAKELAGITDAEIVLYHSRPSFLELLGIFGEAKSPNKIEIDVSDRLLPRLKPGWAYYLPPHLFP